MKVRHSVSDLLGWCFGGVLGFVMFDLGRCFQVGVGARDSVVSGCLAGDSIGRVLRTTDRDSTATRFGTSLTRPRQHKQPRPQQRQHSYSCEREEPPPHSNRTTIGIPTSLPSRLRCRRATRESPDYWRDLRSRSAHVARPQGARRTALLIHRQRQALTSLRSVPSLRPRTRFSRTPTATAQQDFNSHHKYQSSGLARPPCRADGRR